LVRGSPRWQGDFGLDALGKRKRLFFETEAKADGAIDAHKKGVKRGEEYLARMNKVERQARIGSRQKDSSWPSPGHRSTRLKHSPNAFARRHSFPFPAHLIASSLSKSSCCEPEVDA